MTGCADSNSRDNDCTPACALPKTKRGHSARSVEVLLRRTTASLLTLRLTRLRKESLHGVDLAAAEDTASPGRTWNVVTCGRAAATDTAHSASGIAARRCRDAPEPASPPCRGDQPGAGAAAPARCRRTVELARGQVGGAQQGAAAASRGVISTRRLASWPRHGAAGLLRDYGVTADDRLHSAPPGVTQQRQAGTAKLEGDNRG